MSMSTQPFASCSREVEVGATAPLVSEGDDEFKIIVCPPPPYDIAIRTNPENQNTTEHEGTQAPATIQSVHDTMGFLAICPRIDKPYEILPVTNQINEAGPGDLSVITVTQYDRDGLTWFDFVQNGENFMSIVFGQPARRGEEQWRTGDVYIQNCEKRIGHVEVCYLEDVNGDVVRVHSSSGTSFVLTKQLECSKPSVSFSETRHGLQLAIASASVGQEEVRQTTVSCCLMPVPVYQSRLMAWKIFEMAWTENGKVLPTFDSVLLIAGWHAWVLKMKGKETRERASSKSGQITSYLCVLFVCLLFMAIIILLKGY